jgi:hypothetical protein
LGLIANNARFLLLPGRTVPNLGSAVLKRVCSRLSDDWQAQYGHPVLALETFVDPSFFRGTVETAAGWDVASAQTGHPFFVRGQPSRHIELKSREKGKDIVRSLVCKPTTGEASGLPMPAQIARVSRDRPTTDYIGYMSEEHDKRAISIVTAKRAKI